MRKLKKGQGVLATRLKWRVVELLREAGYIDIVDEVWIMPVTGYWLKQDCYRWEGQVRGLLNEKPVTLQIASWEPVKLCLCKTLAFEKQQFNSFEFYSGK